MVPQAPGSARGDLGVKVPPMSGNAASNLRHSRRITRLARRRSKGKTSWRDREIAEILSGQRKTPA